MLLIRVCLFSLIATSVFAGPSEDVSSRYETRMQESNLDLRRLQDFDFVFVPGYFSDGLIEIRAPYFKDQMSWLESMAVSVVRVKTHSQEVNEHNAEILRKEIDRHQKPVIIVGHSNGSVVALHMLLDFPETRKKVAGFISLQGAFGGTPLADWALDHRVLSPIAHKLIRFLGGRTQSLERLRVGPSEAFLYRKSAAIARLTEEIPVLSFATTLEESRWSFLYFFHKHLVNWGHPSDGFVPTESEILPGSMYVRTDGLDHADTVMRAYFRRVNRAQITQALCAVLLERL